jgi:hypothetical protein
MFGTHVAISLSNDMARTMSADTSGCRDLSDTRGQDSPNFPGSERWVFAPSMAIKSLFFNKMWGATKIIDNLDNLILL